MTNTLAYLFQTAKVTGFTVQAPGKDREALLNLSKKVQENYFSFRAICIPGEGRQPILEPVQTVIDVTARFFFALKIKLFEEVKKDIKETDDCQGECYKIIFVRNLQIFVISICPGQAFPA